MRTEMFMIHEGPSYSSSVTARFDGEYVVIDSNAGVGYDPDKAGAGSTTSMVLKGGAALWVECIDGQTDGSDWGGRLKVACVTNKGMWIDSSNGWVKAVSSGAEPIWFVDKDDYYEIRQGSKNGRPLVNQGGRLRFVDGATPGQFNIEDR
ncbi:hypothetical protein [Streptomyces sp. CL12-4]|uniref:hypothetical protein n=1 Tax=Streptomyces sp. CL12-4 TaxID=2810306 RepID=UPI001EFA9BE9|nr:hypothetical protein [Streptomyces sp. CL12-4]MCG8969035.1 hypothetical protein [Streptomyces sp. CL12-4]